MIYEPVTEWGKQIASLLRYDDETRLNIHDYLDQVEPVWIKLKEQAEKWTYLESCLGPLGLEVFLKTLERMKKEEKG